MLPSKDDCNRSLGGVMEEIVEFQEAFDGGDLAGAADAIADGIYFFLGLAHRMGLPFDDIWSMVQNANMHKLIGATHRGYPDDAAKPEGWEDPKIPIAQLLRLKRTS
jgi:predicted HAD superfamily Cof-like phosphohydrolase